MTCTAFTSDAIESYTWYKNTVKIANATSTTFLLPNKNRTDDGSYSCSVTTAVLGPSVNSSSITIGFKCKSLFHHKCLGKEHAKMKTTFVLDWEILQSQSLSYLKCNSVECQNQEENIHQKFFNLFKLHFLCKH